MNGLIPRTKDKISYENYIKFMNATQAEIEKNASPGGYYKAVWCRDASFILKDQFQTENFGITLKQILLIWANQIGKESYHSFLQYVNFKELPLIYGRGSPELDFESRIADESIKTRFEGALPTTIYYERRFCEVYGQAPDIDSTALMIYVTSWILTRLVEANEKTNYSMSLNLHTVISELDQDNQGESWFFKVSINDIINFLIPRMLRGISYLQARDIDNDGLLEQKHNEDWMDTLLRTGKVVYSQACWILALNSLSYLLYKLSNEKEVKKLDELAKKAMEAVEEKLWSEKDGCYIDLLDADLHLDKKMHNRLITQDVSLYLVALTENRQNLGEVLHSSHVLDFQNTQNGNDTFLSSQEILARASHSLDTLKKRIWKNNLPLVTEKEIDKTGPWLLKVNEYHNHTFWPWITGIEMLARNRFGKLDDFTLLMGMFIDPNGKIHSNLLHEWVDPNTFAGRGAFPFRTGISSVRLAAKDNHTANIVQFNNAYNR
ncbi:MAG TPA: amylo-alpha-1,6-glucosidase [Candidatus Nitrosocosmicus sp.]|nr:amylo-alpha-1,6-glucosidase [Candidatus Nitrosocosmicus sp.]